MSKKDYIDAVNEIEVKESLKNETLNKAKQTKKINRFNKIYPIASYLNSMQVDFGPKFEEETCYATIKKDGIHEEYKNIEIKPAKQAKETYYKIDDGEFIKYNLGEKIRVEVGKRKRVFK